MYSCFYLSIVVVDNYYGTSNLRLDIFKADCLFEYGNKSNMLLNVLSCFFSRCLQGWEHEKRLGI